MQVASSPHVTLPGLAEKLERLGVYRHEPCPTCARNGLGWDDCDHLEIFDLLYPENIEKIWHGGELRNLSTQVANKVLWKWQHGWNWQDDIERAVDERLGEGKE